jgi:transcriptional regulator with XRE-family HTH domain
MATRKHDKVSAQVRRAIEGCGMTRYAISKQTGIDQATLSRFMSGEGGLSTEALDAIGELIGLKVTLENARRAGKKGK